MTDEYDAQYYARELLNNPLLADTLARLERDAINRAVNAPLTDNLAHQAALAEVRAARTFRQHLEALARDKQVTKAAPA